MMEYCSSVMERDQPLTIVSEENRHRGPRQPGQVILSHGRASDHELVGIRGAGEECTITASVSVAAALPTSTRRCSGGSARQPHSAVAPSPRDVHVAESDALSPSAASEESIQSELSTAGDTSSQFSKEIITFSLFGRIHPKCSKYMSTLSYHAWSYADS